MVRRIAHHLQDVHAAHLGHFHVQQHQVEAVARQQLDGLTAVAGLGDVLQADRFQRTPQAHAHQAAVVHQQHPRLVQTALERCAVVEGFGRSDGQLGEIETAHAPDTGQPPARS